MSAPTPPPPPPGPEARWPGVDGAVVMASAILVVAAAVVRHADVWTWIGLVLVIDAVYLGATALSRRRRR